MLHEQPKMKEMFSSVFATKTQDEWVAVFKGTYIVVTNSHSHEHVCIDVCVFRY